MCLAVPGKVVEWLERSAPFAQAAVEFGGVRRIVSMDFTPEAEVGDYVLVHAGVAISRVDPDEAAKTLELLEQVAEAERREQGSEAPEAGPAAGSGFAAGREPPP